MNPLRFVRFTLAFVASVLMCASTQAAGLFRAYLASDGLDSNPCTVSAPCRLLPAALAAVTDGGEIWMLDSANYNAATVSITKSVTILAVPGAVGSVVSISGPAIVAFTAGTRVALRNLRIVALSGGGGFDGIQVNGAAVLTVDDSVISGNTGSGIVVLAEATVRITNCIIRDNSDSGVVLQNGAKAEISGSRIMNHSLFGVAAISNVPSSTSVTISDSVLYGNAEGLAVIAAGATSSSRGSITRSTVGGNGTGIRVFAVDSGTSLVSVGGNMITGNGTGLEQAGMGGTSTLETLGDNIVRQNSTPTAGTITPVSLM